MNARRWARLAWLAGTASVVLLTIHSLPLAAEPAGDASPADGRWMPSASFFTMGHADKRTADMSSDVRLRPADPPIDRDGQTLGLPWSIGGTLDLASPVLFDVPGKPRFFSHADVGWTYDQEDPVVTRGDPGEPPTLPPGSTVAVAITNVGSSVRAEAKPLVLSGGFGSVFSFQAFDRGFRIRPTLEWMYRRDTIKNTLGGGEVEGTGTSCTPTCRVTYIKNQNEKGFHSLGPGIEVETDIGRMGDFQLGFYGAFRAFYIVSDRKANMQSIGKWTRIDNGQPSTRQDTIFRTRYEREPWHYRFGVGVRVLWSPE